MSEKSGLGGLFVNKKSSSPAGDMNSSPVKAKNVKQRWAIIGMGAIAFVVISSTLLGKKNEVTTVAPKPAGSVLVSPSNVSEKDWKSQEAERARRLETQNLALEERLKRMEQLQLNAAKASDKASAAVKLPSSVVPPPTLGEKEPSAGIPPPPPLPPVPPTTSGAVANPSGPTGLGVSPRAPGLNGGIPAFEVPASPSQMEPQIFKPEPRAVSATVSELESVKSSIQYKKNQYSGFLPAGSFAPVALLNGLDAGTSSTTQANPMPVLMTVTDQATLPGSAKYTIKSCFVLGTGYGDLSAERVYVRYSRMSCVDKRDRLVLSADVSGYLVDSDGKIGLRGKIIDRQGAKLGKALLAGFAQGLSGALGSAQSTVTTTATGTASALGGDSALRASGLSGAQSAAQQLAQFYLKEASAIFPVISIDAGRTGTIVFTDNASLAWSAGDNQYVKDIKPN